VGLTVPAAPMRLAQLVSAGKVVTIPDTSAVKTPDFRLMQRLFASSLHVPVVVNEQDGVISFWSSEKNGFPPAAVELLDPLAGALTDKPESAR
jgi:hypothetical protein